MGRGLRRGRPFDLWRKLFRGKAESQKGAQPPREGLVLVVACVLPIVKSRRAVSEWSQSVAVVLIGRTSPSDDSRCSGGS